MQHTNVDQLLIILDFLYNLVQVMMIHCMVKWKSSVFRYSFLQRMVSLMNVKAIQNGTLPLNSNFSPSKSPACLTSSLGASLASTTFCNMAIASSSSLLLLSFSASLIRHLALPYIPLGLVGYLDKI